MIIEVILLMGAAYAGGRIHGYFKKNKNNNNNDY